MYTQVGQCTGVQHSYSTHAHTYDCTSPHTYVHVWIRVIVQVQTCNFIVKSTVHTYIPYVHLNIHFYVRVCIRTWVTYILSEFYSLDSIIISHKRMYKYNNMMGC